EAGLAAEAIHGNKSQGQRERVLAAFRTGRLRTLIATDIAARGIDIEGISHVVNYDLPNIPESYVHRIGRTARAGADGVAISFCDSEERAFLRDIEKLIRISIPATNRSGRKLDASSAPQPPHTRPTRHPRIFRSSARSHPAETSAATFTTATPSRSAISRARRRRHSSRRVALSARSQKAAATAASGQSRSCNTSGDRVRSLAAP